MKNTTGRYWINQPSNLQPYHKYHGQNVIAAPETDGPEYMQAFFLDPEDPLTSIRIQRLALETGWH